MATVVEHDKRGSTGRYDGIVQAKLAKAEGRIRNLDTLTGVLSVAVLTLVYALVMAILDRSFELALGVRQVSFLIYAVGSVALLAAWTLRPLLRRVNPYYAACEMEKQIPSAKNSVVNWIDLHEQDLPPSIKGAVGQRAAQDLGKVDLEQAFQGRQTVWLGVSTLALGLAVLVLLFVCGLPQFLSLLRRAFVPYEGGIVAKQTQLEVKTGNTTVPVEQPATIAVTVMGKVPDPRQSDALRLYFRYRVSDPYEDPILLDEVEEGRRDWQAIVPASRVRNGFWYKVKGGDDESAEYHVGVRSSPLIKGFEARLHYPNYLGWTDRTTLDPNLHDIAGTEVALVVRTNRAVRKGSLELTLEPDKERRTVPGQLVKDESQVLLFRFVLDKSGTYSVRFTSSEGEEYANPIRYTLVAVQDRPPEVELTKPATDVTLPSNGTLPLEGKASDDIGLTKITLRLQVVDGPALEAKPYRKDKDFKLSDGSYPKKLDYRDFVDLADLNDALGNKAVIAEGKSIEYWLEAEDNYEPEHHVGESKHYKITLAPPNKETQKQQQDREKAKDDKKKHEKKQDEQLKDEGKKREDQAKKSEGNAGKPDDKKPDGNEPNSKPKDEGKEDPTKKKGDPQNQNAKPEAGDGSPNQQDRDKDIQKAEQQIKDAADGKQDGNDGKPDSKDSKGEDKGDPANQPKGDGKDQGKDEKASPKGGSKDGGGKGEQKQDNAQEKNEGNPNAGGANDKAGSKPENNPKPSDAKGEPKDGKGDKTDNATAKGDGQPQAKPAQAADKGAGQGEQKDQAAGKDQGAKPDGQNQPAAAKDANGKKADAKPEGVAKGQPAPTEKGDKKDAGGSNPGMQEDKAQAKAEPQGGGTPKADDKPTKTDGKANVGKAKDEKLSDKEKAELQAKAAKESQDAKPEDVAKLEKDAQGATEQEERDILNKLSQIRNSAADPAAKEAADKAIDKMFNEMVKRNSEPGKAKQPPKDEANPENKDGNPAGKPKDGPGKNNPETSAGKGDPSDKKNEEKGTKKDAGAPSNQGDPNDPNKKPADGKNPADAQVKDKGDPEKNPLAPKPGSGRPDKPLDEQNPSKPPEGGPGDPEDLKKASQLQLENIRRLIKEHPEVLDKASMSTEDFGRYLEAKQKQIEDYAKEARDKADAAANKTEPETRPPGSYTNIGAKPLKPDDPKSGSTNTPGAGAPPPEFRDMYYKRFTKPKANP